MINSKWQFEEGTWPWTNGFKGTPSGQVYLFCDPKTGFLFGWYVILGGVGLLNISQIKNPKNDALTAAPQICGVGIGLVLGCHCFFAVWRFNFWDGGPLDSGDEHGRPKLYAIDNVVVGKHTQTSWQPKVKIFLLYLSTWCLALSSVLVEIWWFSTTRHHPIPSNPPTTLKTGRIRPFFDAPACACNAWLQGVKGLEMMSHRGNVWNVHWETSHLGSLLGSTAAVFP